MPKFTSKPTTVEAFQWTGEPMPSPLIPGFEHDDIGWHVTTIHGQKAYLNPGDWILQEPDGIHFYPCKDEVFRATYEPKQAVNRYDKHDMVQLVSELRAGSLKLGAYRVRDPKTLEWSSIQFHSVYGNTVGAVMGEHEARLFVGFVFDALNPDHTKTHRDLVPICRQFIDDNRVTCAEAASENHVYANAPLLIEAIAECIGYAMEATS